MKSAAKNRKFDKSIFLLILILALVIGMIITGYFFFRPDVLTNTFKKGQPVKILFLVSNGNKVCFMELFLYHPIQKKGGVFHIPPNLGSRIESLDRVDEIGILYKKGTIGPLKKKLEQILGLDIPFYINLDVGEVSKLADLLEGIEIFITNPVDAVYNESRILLPSGSVVLDGDKLKDYILYEEPNEEDREKVSRKQKFIQCLLKRIGEASINKFLQTDEPFDYFYKLLDTNISRKDILTFVKEMSQFNTEHLYPARVEGKEYLVEDKQLLFPHFKGEYLKLNIKQLLDTISSTEAFSDETIIITLEILNGTETTGLAGRTAQIFESYGYDVINVSNADNSNYVSTIFIDRKGKPDIVKKAAQIIQCENIKTGPGDAAVDNEESADITIILGKDFNGTACKK